VSAENPGGSSTLWLPNLAVLLFVALGLFVESPPLTSLRPSNPSTEANVGETQARLWEDPLLVKPPEKLEPSGSSPLRAFLEEANRDKLTARTQKFPDTTDKSATARTLVMPVLLSGGPYAENKETRLRTHYAVLSALGRAQYVADEPDRLRFLNVGRSTGDPQLVRFQVFHVRYLVTDDVHMPDQESYEPYESDPTNSLRIPRAYDTVIVLWLDDTSLTKRTDTSLLHPPQLVDSLNALLRDLLAPALDPSPALLVDIPELPLRPTSNLFIRLLAMVRMVAEVATDPMRWDLKIIGPNTTDDLAEMLEPARQESFKPFRPAEILSPRATAALEVLQISASRRTDAKSIKPDFVGGSAGSAAAAWTIRRTIITDDQLVDVLRQELDLRRVTPGPDHHMVLVGEWDSLYSRGLGRTMAAKLNEAGRSANDPLRTRWAATKKYLHEFSYLRGIDGELTDDKAAPHKSDATPGKSEDSSPEIAAGDPDRAEGRSQYDYLRRLERQLRQLQSTLGADGKVPRAEIGSIGVIGSDPYDKLLILRALRKSFPHAVFFTTDFDASYLERKELEYTRNLVVASSYDLSAPDHLQGRIPPFRDSYQTAAFLTVLEALEVERFDGSPLLATGPRVFEVGRSNYTELTASAKLPASRQYASSSWARWTSTLGWVMIFIVVLAATMGGAAWRWLVKRRARKLFEPVVEIAGLGLAPLALVFILTLLLAQPPAGSHQLVMPVILLFFLPIISYLSTYWSAGREPSDKPGRPPWATRADRMAVGTTLLVLVLTFVLVLWPLAADSSEEPFAWFQGWSIWPTEIVRMLALFISILFILRCESRVTAVTEHVGSAFHRTDESGRTSRPISQSVTAPSNLPDHDLHHYLWPLNGVVEKNPAVGSPQPPATPESSGETTPPIPLTSFDLDSRLCKAFVEGLHWHPRRIRIFCWIVVYFALLFPFMLILGFPAVPARGAYSFALDQGILCASVICYCYLLFLVIDAVVQCAVLIRHLEPCMGRNTSLSDYRAIHVVNAVTEETVGMVYMPFTILFMMVVARNPLFDNWDWPANLVAVFASGLLLLFIASAMMQHYAQAMKAAAIASANKGVRNELRTTTASGTSRKPDEDKVEWLREELAQIQAFDGVVFRPWYHNPIYRAILIPLGGLGSIQLLEQMTKVF